MQNNQGIDVSHFSKSETNIPQLSESLALKNDSALSTRSKIETSWAKHFATVMPQAVVLNADWPDYELTAGLEGEQEVIKLDQVGYLIPFIEGRFHFRLTFV